MTGKKFKQLTNPQIQFSPQDLWIGVKWEKTPLWRTIWFGTLKVKIDLWICIIPMLPIHIMLGTYERKETKL